MQSSFRLCVRCAIETRSNRVEDGPAPRRSRNHEHRRGVAVASLESPWLARDHHSKRARPVRTQARQDTRGFIRVVVIGEEDYCGRRRGRQVDGLDETVDTIVRAALRVEGGNRSRAARRLSVSLRTMQRFAARLGTPVGARER
jgi:hypothetical protein